MRMHLMYLHFALLQSWKIKHFFKWGENYIYTLRRKEIKGKLTSLSVCRRFSGEKVCVWLFVRSFRGSTRLLESQLTAPPCRGSQRPSLAPVDRHQPPELLTALKTLTSVSSLVTYRSSFPPLVVMGRAMVRYSRLTGKVPVET